MKVTVELSEKDLAVISAFVRAEADERVAERYVRAAVEHCLSLDSYALKAARKRRSKA